MFAKKTHRNTKDPKPDGSFFSPKVQAKLKTDNTDFMNSQVVHQSGNGGSVQTEKADEELQTRLSASESTILQKTEEEESVQAMEEEEAQTKLQFKGQPRGSKAVHRVAKSGFKGSAGAYPFFNKIKASFGRHDVSGIKAYSDGAAINANKSLGALAYASGEKVAFKKAPDLHTAAHEAAHVIQQKQGVQLKDGLGTKNDKYEHHADAVADMVVRGKSAEHLLYKSPTGSSGSVSRKPVQFDGELATAWDVYVYPGNADPAWSDEITDEVKGIGRQVRSFQSLNNRGLSQDNGNRIVNVESDHLDKGAGNTRFQDSQTATSTIPHLWWLEVVDNVLFDGAPVPSDLKQGGLADCFILAPLQAMASNPTGKAELQTNASETGGQYQVELHRLQIIGNDCIPHPTDMIRVRMDSVKSDGGVKDTIKTTPLTAAEIHAARAKDPNIKPTDIVLGTMSKQILWPWAYEKAFASVTGGYSGINFGHTGMAMMVLTGKASRTVPVNAPNTAIIFKTLPAHLANDKIASVGTRLKPDLVSQGFYSSFSISEATEADGVKVRSGILGPLSNWIPWNTFLNHAKAYTIMDVRNILGSNKVLIPHTEVQDHRKTIIESAVESSVIITGSWTNNLVFGKNYWVVPKHIYSISSISGATVDLRNPWGRLDLHGLSQNRFTEIFRSFSYEV